MFWRREAPTNEKKNRRTRLGFPGQNSGKDFGYSARRFGGNNTQLDVQRLCCQKFQVAVGMPVARRPPCIAECKRALGLR